MKVDGLILAVDDDEDICELITSTATAMGLQCFATTNVGVFLDAITDDTSMILLDLKMPGIDGIELLRQLGDQHCKAGIVLMSGVGIRIIETARDLAQAHGLTTIGHLQKPFHVSEVEELFASCPNAFSKPASTQRAKIILKDDELLRAIDRNEFVVHYQPQIELVRGEVVGLEVLTRWLHPGNGLIFPDQFIARLEELGLIDQLGWLVLDRALIEASSFGDRNGIVPFLSINVSPCSLGNLRFPDMVASTIAQHGFAPERIILEITESALIGDPTRSLDVLTRLRMKQLQLSIDDFGTGYSTMYQMRNIPATELKIDKSFVQGIELRDGDRVLVQKTIEIGHELGMKVVAEGVETHEQLKFLQEHGCDVAQGFLIGRPLPSGEIIRWLAENRALHSAAVQ